MSKPHYKWWSYVKAMIRDYPTLKQQYQELHNTSVVASISGMPRGSDTSRTVESAALQELPPVEQREYEAVRQAVETTERYKDGQYRLKVVDLVLWKQTHTLEGAALETRCSIATAKRWHGEFIRLVASYYGLLD